jgi:DNA-binding transcriptional LysR family regulator
MELRHLRYFVALSESLHFGQAAAKLGITQPSLTQQIQQLEGELHATLLRRTKRRVELTEAGRQFMEEARDIVAHADRAAIAARRAAGKNGGQALRVAIGYCMDYAAIGKAVSRFSGRHDGTHLELQTMAIGLQFAALRDQQVDVGFLRPPVTDRSLSTEVLVRESLIAALPGKHRFASKAELPLTALARESLILPAPDLVPVFHDIVLRVCREAGFVPDAPHEADCLPMVLGMVAAGIGVALVPASARKIRPRGIAFVSLRPSPPLLETAIAWRGDNPSPLLQEFVTVTRKVVAGDANKRGAAANRRS